MDIRNCTRCKKIYQYDGFKICHNCRKNDELDFQKVKEYLEEYPGANISNVVENTGVDTKKVIEFLKEGRLEIEGGGDIILECESCGVGIKTGRFCDKCAGGLQRELGQAMKGGRRSEDSKGSSSKAQFRIADRHDRRR